MSDICGNSWVDLLEHVKSRTSRAIQTYPDIEGRSGLPYTPAVWLFSLTWYNTDNSAHSSKASPQIVTAVPAYICI